MSFLIFKPSFKCLKNEKINYIQAILKLETLLYQNIYIILSYFLSVEPFRLKQQQKKWFSSLKNMPN
jgi:hypothetical protein